MREFRDLPINPTGFFGGFGLREGVLEAPNSMFQAGWAAVKIR